MNFTCVAVASSLTHFIPCIRRCDAINFHLSKSNKKLIKRFNSYLKNGTKSGKDADGHDINSAGAITTTDPNESWGASDNISAMMNSRRPMKAVDVNSIQIVDNITSDVPTGCTTNEHLVDRANVTSVASDSNVACRNDASELKSATSLNSSAVNVAKANDVAGPDPNKPLRKKAKLLRIERKKEKQQAAQTAGPQMATEKHTERMKHNQEVTLRSLIESVTADGAHQLQVFAIHFEYAVEKCSDGRDFACICR